MPRPPTTTAEAIKQRRPFRTPRQEAAIAMLLAAEALRRRFVDLLAAHGEVTMQQYNVLRILRGAGAEGLPTLAIAERMIEKTPGITGMIDRLEAKSLVARSPSAEDRRQVLCRITARGLAVLADLDKPMDDLDEEVLGCLSDAETRHLTGFLDRIRNHNS